MRQIYVRKRRQRKRKEQTLSSSSWIWGWIANKFPAVVLRTQSFQISRRISMHAVSFQPCALKS
eukprot:1669555-Rhodomonas_salina.1